MLSSRQRSILTIARRKVERYCTGYKGRIRADTTNFPDFSSARNEEDVEGRILMRNPGVTFEFTGFVDGGSIVLYWWQILEKGKVIAP